MAARICMQLLCIKLSCITQKQAQIFDKLSFKLSFTALNPDSVGKFLGKTSGTYWSLPLRAYSTVQYCAHHACRGCSIQRLGNRVRLGQQGWGGG